VKSCKVSRTLVLWNLEPTSFDVLMARLLNLSHSLLNLSHRKRLKECGVQIVRCRDDEMRQKSENASSIDKFTENRGGTLFRRNPESTSLDVVIALKLKHMK
jgi:hypothetical protein